MPDNTLYLSTIKNEIVPSTKKRRRNATCDTIEYEKEKDIELCKEIKKLKIDDPIN